MTASAGRAAEADKPLLLRFELAATWKGKLHGLLH
jgi:hypothetical protein